MAKPKITKPLFSVKHDFVESLDAFLHEAIFFHQAVKQTLDLGQVNEKAAPILRERCDAFRKKLMSED